MTRASSADDLDAAPRGIASGTDPAAGPGPVARVLAREGGSV